MTFLSGANRDGTAGRQSECVQGGRLGNITCKRMTGYSSALGGEKGGGPIGHFCQTQTKGGGDVLSALHNKGLGELNQRLRGGT